MGETAASRRLREAIELRGEAAAQVLSGALRRARPLVAGERWEQVRPRAGKKQLGDFPELSPDWATQRAVELGMAVAQAEPSAGHAAFAVIHRLWWLADGRLAETWSVAEPGTCEAAFKAQIVNAREAIAAFALPALLLRLASALAARGPGEPSADSDTAAGTIDVDEARRRVTRLLDETSSTLDALVKQSKGEAVEAPGPLDRLLEQIAEALEDGADSLQSAAAEL